MRISSYLALEKGVLWALGFDPSTDSTSFLRGEIASLASQAMDQAWHYVPEGWPELRQVEQRTAVDYVIALDGPGVKPVAQVLTVTERHPYKDANQGPILFDVTAEGIVLNNRWGATQSCWLAFLSPAPQYSSAVWETEEDYITGLVVRAEDGHCYECQEDHESGEWATDLAAGKWLLQPIPAFLAKAFQSAVVAAMREKSGESGRAQMLSQMMEQQLNRICERYDFSRTGGAQRDL